MRNPKPFLPFLLHFFSWLPAETLPRPGVIVPNERRKEKKFQVLVCSKFFLTDNNINSISIIK